VCERSEVHKVSEKNRSMRQRAQENVGAWLADILVGKQMNED